MPRQRKRGETREHAREKEASASWGSCSRVRVWELTVLDRSLNASDIFPSCFSSFEFAIEVVLSLSLNVRDKRKEGIRN